MNLYAIFGRVVQVGLQEGGVNSIRVIHLFPRYLDTIVTMRLVRHPMYIVGISPPYKFKHIIHMHFTYITLYVRMHACTHIYIYSLYIYVCAQGLYSFSCTLPV